MKFQTIQYVTAEEVAVQVRELIEMEGSGNKAARKIGEKHRQSLVNLVSGVQGPSAKILDYFGLEKHVVYVRKDQSQGK